MKTETITLKKGYASEDAWTFEIDLMEIQINMEMRKKLKSIMSLVKENDLHCAEFFYWGESLLCNEEGIEETEFRGGLYFKVYHDAVYFVAEHKHNSQAVIESEPFTITDEFEIKLYAV